MRKTCLGVVVAAAGLLGACAGKDVRDEGLLRIEESMRPDTHPPPEGISLGLDAPPLAPPDRDVLWAPVHSFPERMREIGTHSPHFYSGPYAFPLMGPGPYCPPRMMTPRYHIEQQPGGTTPGLLP